MQKLSTFIFISVILSTGIFLQIMLWENAHAFDKDLADKDISLAIESEMLHNASIPSHKIDVITEEGIVTISGSVGNLLAKERALKTIQAIKGVRAIIDRLTVIPVIRPDDSVKADIERALFNDPVTDSYEVNIDVKDGLITLTGTVESWQEKQLCTEVTKGVKGVKEIKNELLVKYKNDRPDHEIAAEVERRLTSDILLDQSLVQVNVRDGKVRLSGAVVSLADKVRAYMNAWVSGVKTVDDDDLEIHWQRDEDMRLDHQTLIKSDKDIENAIRDAFSNDPRVSAFKPEVKVANGTVVLTGVVDNLQAKQAAEQDAKNTVGVWRVKNYLKVRPPQPIEDDFIARSVRIAFMEDPIVERFEMTVNVYDGKVSLHGMVDSRFERTRAEEIAARVNGVVAIQNNIMLDKGWTPKSDQEIRMDLEDEFYWNPWIDRKKIQVSVEDGIVQLYGAVGNWYERHSASEEAYEAGARKVQNYLEISK